MSAPQGRCILLTEVCHTLFGANEGTALVIWLGQGYNTTTPGPSPSGTQPPTSPTPTPFPGLEMKKAPCANIEHFKDSFHMEMLLHLGPFSSKIRSQARQAVRAR